MTSPELSTIISRIKKSLLSPDIKIINNGHQITKHWQLTPTGHDFDMNIDQFDKNKTIMTHVPIGISAEEDYLRASIPVLKYLFGPDIKDRIAAQSEIVDIPQSFWPDLLIIVDVEKSDFDKNQIVISESLLTGTCIQSISDFKLETSMEKLNIIRNQIPDTFITDNDETYAAGILFENLVRLHPNNPSLNDFQSITNNQHARYLSLFTLFQKYVDSKYTPAFVDENLMIRPLSDFLSNFKEPQSELKDFIENYICLKNIILNNKNSSNYHYGSGISIQNKTKYLFKLPSKIENDIPKFGIFEYNTNELKIEVLDDLFENTPVGDALILIFSEIMDDDNCPQNRHIYNLQDEFENKNYRHKTIENFRDLAIAKSQTFIPSNKDSLTIIDNDTYYDPKSGDFNMTDIVHTQEHDTAKLMTELATKNLLGNDLLLAYSNKIVRIGQNQTYLNSLELITLIKEES